MAPDPVPALVTLDVWGVSGRGVPAAVARMAIDRAPLRRTRGLRFAKLLGTGSGRTFTVRDADPRHWALLSTWDSPVDRVRFDTSRPAAAWARLADEHWRADLIPISSRGLWSRRKPFGDPRPPRTSSIARVDGRIPALPGPGLVPRRAATFWRAVPPVSADLHES